MSKSKKKLILVLLILGMMFTLAACGGNSDGDAQQTSGSNVLDDAKKMLTAGGREYGEVIAGGMNETLTCSFFDFEITGVKSETELEGYQPSQEGYKFVIADVTVKNVFDDPIPVGNYDFNIVWNGGEDYAYEEFMDGMYPDDVELAVGETLSGALVFEIPEDINEFMVVYEEYWDDDFQGNTYTIECQL